MCTVHTQKQLHLKTAHQKLLQGKQTQILCQQSCHIPATGGYTPEKQAKTLKTKSNKRHSSWCHAQNISTNIKPDEHKNKDFWPQETKRAQLGA